MKTSVGNLKPRQDDYPDWICPACAQAAGKSWPKGKVSTFHMGVCGICGDSVMVCSPGSWGHLSAVELERARQSHGK
jgi:hypothetical protein